GVIADGQGIATIVDDEPRISIGSASATEGNDGTTDMVFSVTLSNATDAPLTVDFATADDTASAGSDYQAVAGTLIFAPGETSKAITVIAYGDQVIEYDESFVVNLSSGSQAWGTILNDDGVLVNIGDSSVYEGDYGTTLIGFT